MNIKDKVAVITGSSRGIGHAIALCLAKAGAHTVVNYHKSKNEAERLVHNLKSLGVNSIAVQADIAVEKEVESMSKFVKKEFDGIDILVNNAAVISRPGAWNSLDFNSMNITIDTNLKGLLYCLRHFVPHMLDKKEGAIINIASTYGISGSPKIIDYSATKAAIINVTQSMAKELGKYNITVNAIAPGIIDTDMTNAADSNFKKTMISKCLMGRLGKPEEVADAAKFLIESAFITGHTLIIDGGLTINC
jgi:3-oxoacyl-[acyl-carrier protein] reductase